jgi:hypothetical protein
LELGEGGAFHEEKLEVVWRELTIWQREGDQPGHFGESGEECGDLFSSEIA